MNKQQLIDKAIDDLGGEFKPRGKYVILGGDILAIAYIGSQMQCVCGRQEFEARKAERDKEKHDARERMLGMIKPYAKQPKQRWFDYENQKALRLPPVGERCFVAADEHVSGYSFESCEIVKHIGASAAFVTADYIGMFDDVSKFKPFDWNKCINAGLSEIAEIICEHVGDSGCVSAAKAILVAGYRKCDN